MIERIESNPEVALVQGENEAIEAIQITRPGGGSNDEKVAGTTG